MPKECLTDLYQRLEVQGANLDHLRAVTDHMTRQSNAEAARLARLYFGKEEGEAIGAVDFCDRIEDMTEHAWGLTGAISNLTDGEESRFNRGVRRLAVDLAEDLERLSEAFTAEFAAARAARVSNPALSLAFVRCDAARQAINRHKGPDDLPVGLVDAEGDALMALALCPCKAEDVPSKLRYLLQAHKRDHGDMWPGAGSPWIMAALDFHFGSGWTDRANAAAWREDIGTEALDDAETAELLKDPAIAEALDKIGGQ